jgi:amidase
MPFRFVLGLVTALLISSGAHATPLDLETATIVQLEAAMTSAELSSEHLTELYLKRIEAYDKNGPAINTVITLNPKALEIARALDGERKEKGPRSPIHGIPIVLKDNYNTFDLPTTAGSQLLAGSIPPADAFMVKKLRDAGAVIIAKVNMSEFAGGGSGGNAGPVPNGFSSMGGQTHNPHDLTRGPAGSSGGTGAAIAAAFAQFGLGTDTGGSIRSPCSVNGIAGLKPTHGLLSRAGIVPLALTFDTGGPMARSVSDVAVALGIMTGLDPADPATAKSEGKFEKNYTQYLKTGSLKGARIGVARDFMGKDAGTDRVIEAAIDTLRKQGATIIDPLNFPEYLLKAKQPILMTVINAEFKDQIAQYLSTLKSTYPKSLSELAEKASDPQTHYRSPQKAAGLMYTNSFALSIQSPAFMAAKNQGLMAIQSAITALFDEHHLDAIVYPTLPRPAQPIQPPATPAPTDSATSFANETGFPDFIVPAGMTNDGLPVTLSFFGRAFSEPKLIGYAYDFEQATNARVLPRYTPALPSDKLTP